ncbi:MAG: alpha-amylase family glycosyl hydrolase [Cytophagales bacterium]|nr:alpha-amylase family glycosyl hydrolase [Cytophagales bacterium]
MKYLLVLLTAAACLACDSTKAPRHAATSHEHEVASWPNVVMYEIFVQSYADSDGDGIGDIKGMTGKLDYLQDLGIKGIWLMPIMPSPSYHKYDVTDYYDIHPDYGTMEDFKIFLAEAHKRDIKIVIDMIINHSSNLHPWFLDSQKGEDAEYRDYYTWLTDEEIEQFSSIEKEATGDSYNVTQWHSAEGNDKKFYGFFTGMMPDLNYDNEKVREEVIEIGRYWLEDVGVDGFRLDAAKHIYEDSRVKDNRKWWKVYRAELEKVKPDNYLVGEVWDNAGFVAPFLHGLPALFNFDLAFSMLESIKREKSVTAFISEHSWEVDESISFEAGYIKNQQVYRNETTDYEDAVFLSNHDQNRILSVLGENINKGKLAASILLTMPGTPYIYYGEEIGMLGMKPDPNIREPFLWNARREDQERTEWIDPEYTTDETVVPLRIQMNDKSSIYHHYKSLIYTRNRSGALTYGDFSNAHYGNGDLISFYRKNEEDTLLIVHNLTNRLIPVQLALKDEAFKEVIFSTCDEQLNDSGFDLKPYSSIVLAGR